MSLKSIPIKPGELKLALTQLRKDRWLKNEISRDPEKVKRCRANPFNSLITAICGQQISVVAAAAIKQRMLVAAGSPSFTPHAIDEQGRQKLLDCGLSQAKGAAVHACARYWLDHPKIVKNFPQMSNAAIIEHLTSIKGVGPWTVDMVLIFGLGRTDVLPLTDAGIINGAKRLFKVDDTSKALAKLAHFGPNWQPYRTVASVYLWAQID